MEAVDVTIGLVVRNVSPALPKVLAHLEQQSYPASRFEVVVADWQSTDDTPDVLSRHSESSPVKIRIVNADVPTLPAARNLVLRESRGHWVILLDSELLASPKLVESHVRAQDQHGGDCVVVGRIEPHPQTGPRSRLRGFIAPDAGPFAHGQPLRFLDWRCWNLSAPRLLLVEAGGFDETMALPGLEDVELAWRLERSGMHGFFSENAIAYSWRELTIDRELELRYSEGFTLWHVLDKTGSDILANRYLGPGGRSWSVPALMFAPMYRRICHSLSLPSGPYDWVCRRMARTAVIQGYRDAKRGRPPRYRAGATP